MNYADSKLLVEYSKIQLEIALAKEGAVEQRSDIPEVDRWLDAGERAQLRKQAEAQRRAGVRAMRSFIDHLAPRTRAKHMADLRAFVEAVRVLAAKAKASGDLTGLADLTIDTREESPVAP